MPIHMRMRKLRGPHMKKSMPFEMFRTHDPAASTCRTSRRASTRAPRSRSRTLKAAGLAKKSDVPVKILAKGEITKPLTVHAHKFSASAKAAIEAAGGTAVTIES